MTRERSALRAKEPEVSPSEDALVPVPAVHAGLSVVGVQTGSLS